MLAARVLEIGNHEGAHCGRILADLGADVIKIEPPGGDPSRRLGPSIGDRPGDDRALRWLADNANKRSIVLDLADPATRARLRTLVERADVVVSAARPGRLEALEIGYGTLASWNAGIVLVSIGPYGETGPLATAPASDLEVSAAGGAVWLAGEPGRAPVRTSLPQAWYWAGMYGAMGALLALQARRRTGRGQHVDVSAQAAMVTALPPANIWWDIAREDHARTGQFLMGRSTVGARFRTIYPCKDGHVAFAIQGGGIGRHTGRQLAAWMKERGMPTSRVAAVDWERFDQRVLTQDQVDALESDVAAFLLTLTKREFYEGAIERVMLGYLVADAKDVYEDEQLRARSFWQQVEVPEAGRRVPFPGGFALFDGERPSVRRPAPRIGQHDDEVRAETDRVERTRTSIGPATGAPSALEGLRVVELGWAAAGPLVGKYLANFGAEVIHVESRKALDVFRSAYPPFKDNVVGEDRAAMFAFYNDGKKGVTLDLKNPKGVELARALIETADVLIESFPAGQMARWGLDIADLRARSPRLVALSTCNQGQTGPHARHPGYGSQLTAQAGFVNLLGEAGRTPVILYGPYIDYIGTGYGVVAVLAALERRERTGEGCAIDLSQYEAGLQFMAPALLEYQLNGRTPQRDGNRDHDAAPHGVYPCRDEAGAPGAPAASPAKKDRWVALSVWDDQRWRQLVDALGSPEWAKDARLATCAGRRALAAWLDERIGEWTRTRSRDEVVDTLRQAGIRVAPVNTVSELFTDPQLASRGFFQKLPHPVIGEVTCMSSPAMLLGTPSRMERAGPVLGADNDAVFGGLLGLSDSERAVLAAEGAFE